MVYYEYGVFGETVSSADGIPNPYQYNAEYTDTATGLQYLRARYYDSEINRFLTKDTYLGETNEPLTKNLYAYANNNPINLNDPSGHLFGLIMGIITVGVTIYSSYKAVKSHNQQSAQIRQNQSSYENKGTVQTGKISGTSYAEPTSANQTGSFSYYNARDNKTVTFTSAADYFAYKKLCDELDALDKNLASQIVHNTLDAVGVISGVGEVADALNGIVYLAEGDKANAALSFVSCVPLAGDAIGKGAKNAGKLLGVASDSAKYVDDVVELGQSAAKNGKEMIEAVVDNSDEAIEAIENTIKNSDGATDTVKSAVKNSDSATDVVKSTAKNNEVASDVAKNVATDKEPVTIVLKYKDGWTDAQKAAADAKVKALTEAHTEKTIVDKRTTSASKTYKTEYGAESVPKGSDVDHVIDLQLGGDDVVSNMSPLDSSVNRSLGAQIMHAIKDYPVGTVFGDFIIQ